MVASPDNAALLAAINGELAHQPDPVRQSQLLSMVADSQMRRGDFAGAVVTHDRAAALTGDDQRKWFRPAIGAVFALLKDVRVADAQARANAALARAITFDQQHAAEIAGIEAQLRAGVVVRVGRRPLRASVVATRLGKIFIDEGEAEIGKVFLRQALTINPQGASRARLALAEIALRENQLEDAKSLAFSALQVGQFHAKTLAALPLFLEANFRLGLDAFDQRLIDGLAQATPKVRDRAMLAIVETLRSQSNPRWIDLATAWLTDNSARNPRVAAEFRKLLQSAARSRNEAFAAQSGASQNLLATANLSPTEFLSAGKTQVRATLLLEQNVDLFSFANTAAQRYGPPWRGRVLHSLALSCMMARRHDLARPLLQQNIASLPAGDPEFAKSLWALARMEAVLQNHHDAAVLYRRFAIEPAISPRYRLQAQLKWLNALLAAGETAPIADAQNEIAAALAQVNDYSVLLGFARQLRSGPPALRELAKALFERGEAQAMAEFNSATQPAVALRALLHATRSQVYDFGKSKSVFATWSGLTAQKRDWLWSASSEFWEYLALVFIAMRRVNQAAAADQLGATYLADPATPIEGRLLLMGADGIAKIRERNPAGALQIFASMVALAPAHRHCAEAYYWLALSAKKQGDETKCVEFARKIQLAQGSRIGLLLEWQLDCKASLLRSNLVPGTPLQSANYSETFQNRCLAAIQADSGRL